MSASQNLPVLRDDLGAYMAEIRRFPLLSAAEEYEMAKDWQTTGSVTAAHRLVTSNLRFVVKIAVEYRGYGLKIIELVQEGNIGLMQAVKRFNPDRGYRLITYAVHWIRAYIHQYIMRSLSIVRMGASRAQRKLFYKLGEIRALLDHDVESRDEATRQMAANLRVDTADIIELQNRLLTPDVSLDAPLTDDDDSSSFEDNLAANGSLEESAIKCDLQTQTQRAVSQALATLNDREREIIRARYLSEEPASLQSLGATLGISRERVRQLEARAMEKLRAALTPNEASQQLLCC